MMPKDHLRTAYFVLCKEAFFKRNTKYVELKAGVTFDPRKTSVIALIAVLNGIGGNI